MNIEFDQEAMPAVEAARDPAAPMGARASAALAVVAGSLADMLVEARTSLKEAVTDSLYRSIGVIVDPDTPPIGLGRVLDMLTEKFTNPDSRYLEVSVFDLAMAMCAIDSAYIVKTAHEQRNGTMPGNGIEVHLTDIEEPRMNLPAIFVALTTIDVEVAKYLCDSSLMGHSPSANADADSRH